MFNKIQRAHHRDNAKPQLERGRPACGSALLEVRRGVDVVLRHPHIVFLPS